MKKETATVNMKFYNDQEAINEIKTHNARYCNYQRKAKIHCEGIDSEKCISCIKLMCNYCGEHRPLVQINAVNGWGGDSVCSECNEKLNKN